MGTATQDLRNEHVTILRVVDIMDGMSKVNNENTGKLKYCNELVYFLKIFIDKCHHGKEENHLFRDLEANGVSRKEDPLESILREHKQGRELVAAMSRSAGSRDLKAFDGAASKYGVLLRRLIAKENDALFVIADRLIDDAKQNALFKEFELHEEDSIGHGIHERLHSMLDVWSDRFEEHKY
jgi:hemerythrin-like domain-containing protein